MHKSYFLYRALIKAYQDELSGKRIKSFYTQHKNEFVLELESSSLIIALHHFLPFLISRSEYYRKSQSMDLFSGIIDDEIKSFKIINNYRVMRIKLKSHLIFINLFHRNPGISIYKDENELISYKNSLSSELLKSETINEESHFYKDLQSEIAERQMSSSELIDELKQSNKLYYYSESGKKKISLIKLKTMVNVSFKIFENITEGFASFIFSLIAEKRFDDLYHRINKILSREVKSLETTLNKLNAIELDDKQKEKYEQYGHLILANKELVKEHMTELTVQNLYSEKQEDLTIKLKPNKTFHENAEIYYHKSKAFDSNKKEIEVRKKVYSKKLNDLINIKLDFERSKRYKDLEKVKNSLLRLGYLESGTNKEKRIMKDKSFSSIEYDFDGETVIVGKDSKSNDYLSIKYAKPNDYWFHVHGSPGSHVVLRWHGKKEKPTKDLLEKIASIAAYHSKQKNAGTVPVIYTLAKYVRKPKGAKAGSVSVNNEKSIFVKPRAYEDLF